MLKFRLMDELTNPWRRRASYRFEVDNLMTISQMGSILVGLQGFMQMDTLVGVDIRRVVKQMDDSTIISIAFSTDRPLVALDTTDAHRLYHSPVSDFHKPAKTYTGSEAVNHIFETKFKRTAQTEYEFRTYLNPKSLYDFLCLDVASGRMSSYGDTLTYCEGVVRALKGAVDQLNRDIGGHFLVFQPHDGLMLPTVRHSVSPVVMTENTRRWSGTGIMEWASMVKAHFTGKSVDELSEEE